MPPVRRCTGFCGWAEPHLRMNRRWRDSRLPSPIHQPLGLPGWFGSGGISRDYSMEHATAPPLALWAGDGHPAWQAGIQALRGNPRHLTGVSRFVDNFNTP